MLPLVDETLILVGFVHQFSGFRSKNHFEWHILWIYVGSLYVILVGFCVQFIVCMVLWNNETNIFYGCNIHASCL